MKSHTFTSRSIVLLALGLCLVQGMALAQLPESTKNTELYKELDIFGSVIKDSLAEKGVVKSLAARGGETVTIRPGTPGMPMGAPGLIGKSPFDWGLHCQYVPTVGAIYTIPVSFPLVNPEKEAEKPEATEGKEEELDLWEKHEKEAQEAPRSGTAQSPAMMNGEMFLPGMPGPTGNRAFGESYDPFGPTGPMGPMGFGASSTPAYDPEKVKSLRSTLIDVLAQYGFRLKDLPEDEQILFIETSDSRPFKASGSMFIKSGGGGKSTGVFFSPTSTPESSGDQYLLAIRKAEIDAKYAPEDIEGKLTERVF